MNISASPVKGAILVPFLALIMLGGPWARSASVIPKVLAWNVTAPEGTYLTASSTDQTCRLQIHRVSKKSNGAIRIERKLQRHHLQVGRLSFEVKSDPPLTISAEIYEHHAPWSALSERRSIPVEPGLHHITWPVETDLVEKDAYVVFYIEPHVGEVKIKDVGVSPDK